MPRHLAHKRAIAGTIVAAVVTGGLIAAPSPARAATAPARAATRAATATTRALTAGTAVSVTAIAFPDAASGWALGSEGNGTRIWHTDTAGSAWQAQWRGTGTPLAITASDVAHAWALTGCAKPCGRRLLGTTDGGRHWRVLTTWPASAPVNLVQFATAGLGVAISDGCLTNPGLASCPGRVLVSHDGGAHWNTALSQRAPVFAVAAASGQLWAAETVPGAARTGVAIRFVTSTDGGRIWDRLGQLTGIWPLSAAVRVTLAVAGGRLSWGSVFDQETCAMHGCGVADVLSSADGGRSWSTVNLPDAYPDECANASVALSAAPDGAIWAATGRNGAACRPPLGLAYMAAGQGGPGGGIPRAESSGWQQLPPWQLTSIGSLAAVSGQVAYAIGDQGVLSRTENGGREWTQVLPSAVPAGAVAAVPLNGAPASDSGSVAFGAQDVNDAGAVLRAAPGGGAWQQVADLPGVVTQVGFPTATSGFAVSYTAGSAPAWRLWTTSDGGKKWAQPGSLPATTGAIEGPWLTADGRGLLLTVANGTPWEPASGGTGAVREWTTSNGGATWTGGGALPLGGDILDGPASFWYSPGSPGSWTGWLSVANASYTQEVAAFSGGRLTVLAGKPPSGNVQLTGPDAGFAWGVTYAGRSSSLVIYRTSDGGRTWRHESVALPAGDQATPLLGFASLDDGWLVLGGTTWRTTNGGLTWHTG